MKSSHRPNKQFVGTLFHSRKKHLRYGSLYTREAHAISQKNAEIQYAIFILFVKNNGEKE